MCKAARRGLLRASGGHDDGDRDSRNHDDRIPYLGRAEIAPLAAPTLPGESRSIQQARTGTAWLPALARPVGTRSPIAQKEYANDVPSRSTRDRPQPARAVPARGG